jgi:carbonic anhydrase
MKFSSRADWSGCLLAVSVSAALCGWSTLAAASDAHAAEPKAETAKKKEAVKEADAEAKPARKEAAEGKPSAKSEHGAPEAKPGRKAEAAPEPEPKREEPKSAKAGSKDPMDAIRERLAEKLGATKSPDPRVLRVSSRSTAPDAVHGAGVARAAPNAAKLALAHRSGGDAGAAGAGGHAAHWDYKGEAGPESWGSLKPEFAQCSSGTRQSPIDIRDGIRVQLDAVRIDYRPSGFRVIDNGHTVQVNVSGGNSIEVLGRRYDLVQFHFHRPSEERINGRQFDMVAHLVHKDLEGRLAVIAVLLDRGSAHPIIQTVWNNLPLEKGEEVPARTSLDLNGLLPADRSYFTYMGSLTTPPCSEGVLWMVMKNPVSISSDQIGIFSRLYPMNARPIQSAAGRLIKESD